MKKVLFLAFILMIASKSLAMYTEKDLFYALNTLKDDYKTSRNTIAEILKVKPELANARFGKDKNTPLHWIARHGYHDIAQLLLDNGANINTKNNLDWTPLFLAILTNPHQETALFFLKQSKVDPFLKVNNGNYDALQLATEKGLEEVVNAIQLKKIARDEQEAMREKACLRTPKDIYFKSE